MLDERAIEAIDPTGGKFGLSSHGLRLVVAAYLAALPVDDGAARVEVNYDYDYIGVKGIRLRRIGDAIQVLVEGEDGWRLVIAERIDGQFSHIAEASGIAAAPLDRLATPDA